MQSNILFYTIIHPVAHKIFQQFATFMESQTISVILDKLLTNMLLASNSNQLAEDTIVEILTNLQLENHLNYFMLSQSGFVSLLSICNSHNVDELDKILHDILLAYINRPESKLHQSKDRKILTNVSEEICYNIPSLSTLLNYQTETKFNLLETISVDVVMNWIKNPNVDRVSMVNLCINHSKIYREHFATNCIKCLSDNISETNFHLYLPLIHSLTVNQAEESMNIYF